MAVGAVAAAGGSVLRSPADLEDPDAVHLIKVEQRPKADITKSMILPDTQENR
jgi:hypothetical protein